MFIQLNIQGGHKTLMKIIKNAGGGWQLFFLMLPGKELTFIINIWMKFCKDM